MTRAKTFGRSSCQGAARPPVRYGTHSFYGNRFVGFCTAAVPGYRTRPVVLRLRNVEFDRDQSPPFRSSSVSRSTASARTDVEPAMRMLLRDARARLEALAARPGERTFDNTMRALDVLTEPLDYAMGVVATWRRWPRIPNCAPRSTRCSRRSARSTPAFRCTRACGRASRRTPATAEGALPHRGPQRYLRKTMDTSAATAPISTRPARSGWRRSTSS